MRCERCGGLVILEGFGGLRAEVTSMWPAARCINCGCLEDAVVRFNRRHPPVEKRQSPRGVVR